jgi:hypothetical protein
MKNPIDQVLILMAQGILNGEEAVLALTDEGFEKLEAARILLDAIEGPQALRLFYIFKCKVNQIKFRQVRKAIEEYWGNTSILERFVAIIGYECAQEKTPGSEIFNRDFNKRLDYFF